MRRHLVLKTGAPDEVEIGVGSDFNKRFKRKDEPFAVTDEHADMLLRSTDYFKEVPAKKEATAKTSSAGTAKNQNSVADVFKEVPAKKTSARKRTKQPAKTVKPITDKITASDAQVEDAAINQTETKIETTDK